MRILTLNTWKCDGDYGRRLTHMVQGLAELSPDVILLQEVFACDDRTADTAGTLAQALSMVASRAPARHKRRVWGGQLKASSSGLAILTREPVVAHHVVPLPSDPADGERVAQLARWMHHGVPVWLANLHLTHLPGAVTLRICQLERCLSALQHLCGTERVVVGGDFNCGPGGPEFEWLLSGRWPWVQAQGIRHKTTHTTEDGWALDLDHLLLSRWPPTATAHLSVVLDPKQARSGAAVSDHAAVMLDIA